MQAGLIDGMAGQEGVVLNEKDKGLKERAIKAIRAHANCRGKPLGVLPRWLEQLCVKEQFRAHATGLKNDNALADYVVGQVKHFSKQKG